MGFDYRGFKPSEGREKYTTCLLYTSTLIFTANQALLAARAGASYVSPFLGRLDDISTNGTELIYDIVQIFDNYQMCIRDRTWPSWISPSPSSVYT